MRESRFEPDYTHLLDAARNREPRRLPLYDHSIAYSTMEKILAVPSPTELTGRERSWTNFLKTSRSFTGRWGMM